jgi:L-galactono-1,4-lactone dehydrogenase
VDANDGKDLEYMKDLLEMIEREGIPAPAPIEQRWSAGSSSPMSPVSNDGRDDAGPGLHSWIGIIMYLPTSVKETRDEITAAFKAYAKREEEMLGEKYAIRTHWAKIESPGWYRGKTLEGADGSLKYDEGEHKARARAPEVARRELEMREEKELEANGKKLHDTVLKAREEDHAKRLERLGLEAGMAYREEQGKILEEVVRMRRTLARRYPVDRFNALRETFDPRGILANAMIENFFAPIDAYASQSTSHKKALEDGFVVDAAPPEFILAIGRTLKRIERFLKPGSVWSLGGLLYDFETAPRATRSEKEKKVLDAIEALDPHEERVVARWKRKSPDAIDKAEEEKSKTTETETETETKTKEAVESRRQGGYIRDKVNLAKNVWSRGWPRGDGGGGPEVSSPPPL